MSNSVGFWRPSLNKGVDRDISAEAAASTFNKNHHLTISQQRRALPIFQYKDAILYLLEKYKTLVLVGETGCGKSTQIPQYLFEAGWAAEGRTIVCTQPRKVAVLTVADRVAQEMGCRIGDEVGYGMRFDFRCSEKTKIRFYTDGVLLRETLSDPLLSRYSVIVVDEAHQRSLQSDILLGLLKKIRRKRSDLRIIVTSATMDAVGMKEFFETHSSAANVDAEDTCILSVQGRVHPIDICYLREPCRDYIAQAVQTVLQIHRSEDNGDVMVFLPGVEEIERVLRALTAAIDDDIAARSAASSASPLQQLYCLPLHASLSQHQQMQVFQRTPSGRRKIIVATNIAETSLTIDGVRFVVDCCLVKLPYHDVRSGLTVLTTGPITAQMAAQRAGRAGRTQSGKCFRLVPEDVFQEVVLASKVSSSAEMARCDVTTALLTLKALGIQDLLHFDFLTPPSPAAVIFALEQLFSLGAIDIQGQLTPRGLQMAELPLEPRWARCVLAARSPRFDVQEEMLSLAAMCTLESPFLVPFTAPSSSSSSSSGTGTGAGNAASREDRERKMRARDRFVVPNSDHLTLLNVFQTYREEVVKRRASDNAAHAWCEEHGLSVRIMTRAEDVRRSLSLALQRFPSLADETDLDERQKPPTSVHVAMEVRLRRCLVAGFFANCARLTTDGRYRTLRGGVALLPLPATSVLASFGSPPEWMIFGEVNSALSASTSSSSQRDQAQQTSSQSNHVWVRDASAIEPLWLAELAAHYYDLKF